MKARPSSSVWFLCLWMAAAAFEPSIPSPYEPVWKQPISMQEAQKRAASFQECNHVVTEGRNDLFSRGRNTSFKRGNRGNEPPTFNTGAYGNHHCYDEATAASSTSFFEEPPSSSIPPPKDTVSHFTTGPTLYDVLGASPDDSRQTLKQKYAIMAKKTHPDATMSATAEEFHRVAEAYAILSDPIERRRYDDSLKLRQQNSVLKTEVEDDDFRVHVNDFSVHVENFASASFVNDASHIYGGPERSRRYNPSVDHRTYVHVHEQPPYMNTNIHPPNNADVRNSRDVFGRGPNRQYVAPDQTDIYSHRDFNSEKGYEEWFAKQQRMERQPHRARHGRDRPRPPRHNVHVNDGRWFQYRTI